MKKILIIILGVFLGIILVFLALFYLYDWSVSNKLSKMEQEVNAQWSSVYQSSNIQLELIQKLEKVSNDTVNRTKLVDAIDENKNNREKYSTECKLEFEELEHQVNENSLALIVQNKNNKDAQNDS